jgi:hypothetical protein
MQRSFWLVGAAIFLLAGSARAQDAVAIYEVVFDATWSAATHPGAVPRVPHFSPPLAVSHDAGVSFWEPGGIASPGMEAMAEAGATSPLDLEFEAAIAAGHARDYDTGDFVLTSPTVETLLVEASLAHPRATFVSMIAPSPDWFVGVTSVPLVVGGQWVDEVRYDLWAWDAGTDAGTTFGSFDIDLEPQLPIALLGDPFTGTPPLGTVTFRRVASSNPCADGVDQDGDGFVDAQDPGCSSAQDPDETDPALACDDGVDGDGDGLADLQDPGCLAPTSRTENPQCQDGVNNDPAQDAGVDFDGGASRNGGVPIAGADPQCTAPWIGREATPTNGFCGFGPELALALPALAALRRARRRAA